MENILPFELICHLKYMIKKSYLFIYNYSCVPLCLITFFSCCIQSRCPYALCSLCAFSTCDAWRHYFFSLSSHPCMYASCQVNGIFHQLLQGIYNFGELGNTDELIRF